MGILASQTRVAHVVSASATGMWTSNCHQGIGECLKCIPNTAGEHCDKCLTVMRRRRLLWRHDKGDCKPCECYEVRTSESRDGPPASDPLTGLCRCLPHVDRNCDKCEDGYFNIMSGEGCESCNCNSEDSYNSLLVTLSVASVIANRASMVNITASAKPTIMVSLKISARIAIATSENPPITSATLAASASVRSMSKGSGATGVWQNNKRRADGQDCEACQKFPELDENYKCRLSQNCVPCSPTLLQCDVAAGCSFCCLSSIRLKLGSFIHLFIA